ncbi:MAG: TonB-dependent receptor [Pseudomonadota bacterium]|nr:TonB-dependent receptor [Pseudomonadota bacterium]
MKNSSGSIIAAAVSIAIFQSAAALPADTDKPANDAPAAVAGGSGNDVNLEEIVVTGVSLPTTKMKSSSSISTLDPVQIQFAAPNSAADALRDIPGIHSEASAGEGNTNVTVRGIPISAGGSRYVGFQEDGLPVLLNGDYAFVTPDMYLKIDGALDHIEAVRGGAASVLGSNSPGAIVNFISRTGQEEGGSVSVSRGLDFDETRYDFDYGQHLSDHTRFFIGGFFRDGNGPRNGDVPIENGGQIKANITQDVGDDGTFIRISYKHLDDRSPLDMPVAFGLSTPNPTKANPATIEAYPGIDPRRASYYSPYWPSVTARDADNNLSVSNLNDGLTVREDALGLQTHIELGNDWKLDENFRKSAKSGSFLVAYPTGAPIAQAAAGTVYAAGPNQGKPYTGAEIELAAFDASLDDLGSTVNALKVSRNFDFAAAGSLNALVGWDTNHQTIAVDQNLPHYMFTASGNQPVPLVGLNAGGIQTDSSGLLPIANGWGVADRRIEYRMSSPYLTLGYEIAQLNFDAGVRDDVERVTGFQSNAGAPAAGTPFIPGVFPSTPTNAVDYHRSNRSYSVGGNYRVFPDLAIFARYSDGASFNVVERMGGPFIGGAPIPINTVKQTEVGVKWRQGGFNSFVTFFKADTNEGNYDLTTQILSENTYTAKGVEIESSYQWGGFGVSGGFTYTDASITGSNIAAVVGDQPHRLAKYIYQVTPSYTLAAFTIGGSLIGTAKSFGDDQNTIIQPSFYTVSLFGNYQFNPHASLSLSANNLFDKIGWTEYDNGQGARSINGRTVRATFKYKL